MATIKPPAPSCSSRREPQVSGWTPTYYNGKVYTAVSGSISQFSSTTGTVDWTLPLPSGSNGTLAIDANRAFVIGSAGLAAVDVTTHAILWTVADSGFNASTIAAVQGNTVYAIHGTQVRGYDVATGALKGSFDAGQSLLGQIILTNDGLIVASSGKTFFARRSDYQLLNSIAVGGQISLADNTLYVATSAGTLYAYRLWSLPSLAVSVPANATEGDGTATGTLTIPSPIGSDLVVSLTSSDPARISVPATVTIPAGQVSATLPLTIFDDALLNGPEAVSITASLAGYNNGVGTITIHDNETAVLTVALPATAAEGAGVLHNAGTLTASAAPSRDIVIQLTSTNAIEVAVPATVTLPAGQTTVSFDVTIGDDWAVDGTQTAVVTAHVENWTDGSATINVYNTNSSALNGEWHTLGNGPSHTGYFAGTLTDTPLARLLWSASNVGANQVAVGGGLVYVSAGGSALHALDERTGALVWGQGYASADSINPPTYDNGQVYIQTDTGNEVGQLWSYNAANGATDVGQLLWLPVGRVSCPDRGRREYLRRWRHLRRDVRLQSDHRGAALLRERAAIRLLDALLLQRQGVLLG